MSEGLSMRDDVFAQINLNIDSRFSFESLIEK